MRACTTWLLAGVSALAFAASASCSHQSAPAPDLLPQNPAVSRACREDLGITDARTCLVVAGLLLPERPPPARGNAHADDASAAELGFRAFFDPHFSTVPEMRCATCHLPEKSFNDGLQVSLGKDAVVLPRNSISLLTAAWSPSEWFWDGRADSLWAQPLFALENEHEMANTRLAIAHTLHDSTIYRPMYERVFGPMPDLGDPARFPSSGKPGDAAFDAMSTTDRDTVNRIAANFGKALEAYMRKLAIGRSALDRYLLGDATALDDGARRGLATFVKSGCASCHGGPAMSDGLYHAMNVPGLPGAASDRGRAAGLAILRDNPFNAQGPYYDATTTPPPPPPRAPAPEDEGAFRTPSLRDVALTAPYGHDGYYPTLEALLADHGSTKLTQDEIHDVVVFLMSLGGVYPSRPWSDWPAN